MRWPAHTLSVVQSHHRQQRFERRLYLRAEICRNIRIALAGDLGEFNAEAPLQERIFARFSKTIAA
jgi:hypothetical protein